SGKYEDGTELISPKDYTVLVVKYISPLHGGYYHKGVERKLDALDNAVVEKIFNTKDLSKNQTWQISTLSLDEVLTPGGGTSFPSQGNNMYNLKLVKGSDNAVAIEQVADSDLTLL